MRVLLLEYESVEKELHRELRRFAETLIVGRLEANLGGIWTEFHDGIEVIRLGFPLETRHDFLRPLSPKRGKETGLSVALGRIVFGRHITDIVMPEPTLVPMVVHALSGHDVRCWHFAEPCPPSELIAVRETVPWKELITHMEQLNMGTSMP